MERRRLYRLILCALMVFVMVISPAFTGYMSLADSIPAGDAAASSEDGITEVTDPDSAQATETEVSPEEPSADAEDQAAEESVSADPAEEPAAANENESVDEAETKNAESAQEKDEVSGKPGSDAEDADAEEDSKASVKKYVGAGDGVRVTAVLSDASAIPDDAMLVVRSVQKDSGKYNYLAYMKALNGQGEGTYTDANTLLFDIAFIKDGVEIEPESGTVSVSVEFLDSQLSEKIGAGSSSELEVVHLPLKGNIREQYDTTADAKKISAGDIKAEPLSGAGSGLQVDFGNEEVSFRTKSFSVFAFSVDFEYNGYSFRMPGGGTITLSKIFDSLNIEESVKDVENAEFSDPELISVTKTLTGDWKLQSLQSFETEETLTVSMKSGAVIVINVTDPPSTSSNLGDFLVSAEINAPTDESGNYVITQGSKYSIDLTFRETMALQFPNEADAVMTYTLPEGLQEADGDHGVFTVWLNDGGTVYEIKNNTFEVVDNVLQVKFNTSDPNFERLTAAANLSFNIAFEAEFDVSQTEVIFEDGIEVDYEVNDKHELKAQKSSSVDKAKDAINYTIKITSTGYNRNVYFQDVMDKPDCITGLANLKISSNKRELGETDAWISGYESYNGTFTGGFEHMLDGEVITIAYSALIDPYLIPTNDQGKVVIDGLSNSFKVNSEDDSDGDGADESTVIDYTPGVEKGRPKAIGDGNTLEWTITANKDAKVSMAGRTIKDTIRQSSRQYMSFDETDVTVETYDAAGNLVETIYKSWGSLEHDDDFSWSYTIPSSDTAPLRYVFTYTTRVDNSSLFTDVSVYNDVTTTGGGTSNNRGIIGPPTPEDRLTIRKEAVDVDLETGEIKWHITINVPKNGLETAYIRETYPHTTINGQNIYEPVDEDSISMEGLLDGETYTYSDNGSGMATITFYRNSDKSVTGLKPSGTGQRRIINVYLSTKISDTWLKASEGKLSLADHENSINVDGITSKDSVTVQEPGVSKTVKASGTRTVDGVQLPVYRYEIVLSHVTDFDNTIRDTFDTSLLEPYTPSGSTDAWYVYGVKLVDGKTTEKKGDNQFSYRETSYGMEITTDYRSVPTDPDSYNNFYPNYKFVYYLTVKDERAYKEIMDKALNDEDGIYKISNSAEWDGESDDTDIDYGYPGLKKELLTPESELKKENDDIWAEFRITANPSAQTLNNGNPIVLTDTAQNLDVDITSVKINGEDSFPGVSYDQTDDHTMRYVIPDATKIVITYRARVAFTTIGNKGETIHVEFNNTASMLGYDDNVKKEAFRNNSGGGIASIPAIDLLKHEAGNITNKLAGAEFKLLDADGNPIKDKNGDDVTFVTGSDGLVKVRGDMEELGWALEEDVMYRLHETKAPAGGYGLAKFDFLFRISKDGTSNHSEHIYHSGDTLNAKNYHVTELDVEKVWSDGNDKHSADSITVKLQQRTGSGEWSDKIRVMDDSENYGWTDLDSLTGILNSQNDWKYSFTDLPTFVPEGEEFEGDDKPADYRIVETEINRQVPEQNTDGAKYKETTYDVTAADDTHPKKITVTNIYVYDIDASFDAQKVFEHGELDDDHVFTFNVSEVTGVDDEGNEILEQISEATTKAPADSEEQATDGSEGKVYFDPITYTLYDLKNDDGTYASERVFTYVIKENVSGRTNENGYDSKTCIQYDTEVRRVTVTLRLVDNELVADIDYGDDGSPVFTNSRIPPEYTQIDVEKVWSDGNEKHDADNITVTLQQKIGDGEWSDTVRLLNEEDWTWKDHESVTAVLDKDNDWKYSFTKLPVILPTGEDFEGEDMRAEYRIVETELNGQVPAQNLDGAKYKETTYDVTEASGDDPAKVTITNIYVPDVDVTFEAEKSFEHGVLDRKHVFTFNVSQVTGVDADGEEILEDVSEAVSEISGKSKGRVFFDPVTYTLDDLKNADGTYADQKVFKYVIAENIPSTADGKGYDSDSGIKYDTKIKRVTVTLRLVDNRLVADVSYGGGSLVFTNTYQPPNTPPPGVETGDDSNILIYVFTMLAAMTIAAFLISLRIRYRRNDR